MLIWRCICTRWQTRKSRADKTCQFWHALQRKRELLYHEYRPLENMPILASRVIGRWRVLASAPRCDLPNLENYRIPYFYKLCAYLHEILLRREEGGYVHKPTGFGNLGFMFKMSEPVPYFSLNRMAEWGRRANQDASHRAARFQKKHWYFLTSSRLNSTTVSQWNSTLDSALERG